MVDKMITNASNKSSFGNNKSSSSPGFPDSSICRYWALGTCVLNQRCRFKHIGPPGIPPASSARRNHRMIVTTTASGRVVVTTDRSSSTGSSVVYRQVTSPPPLPQYSTKTSSPSSPRSVSSFNVGLASTEGVVMNNLDEVRVKQRDNDLLTPQSVDYKTSTTTTDQSSTLNYHHHLLDNRDYNNNVNSVAIINDKNNNNTNSSVDIGVGIATCKYWIQGICNRGSSCRFVHAVTKYTASYMSCSSADELNEISSNIRQNLQHQHQRQNSRVYPSHSSRQQQQLQYSGSTSSSYSLDRVSPSTFAPATSNTTNVAIIKNSSTRSHSLPVYNNPSFTHPTAPPGMNYHFRTKEDMMSYLSSTRSSAEIPHDTTTTTTDPLSASILMCHQHNSNNNGGLVMSNKTSSSDMGLNHHHQQQLQQQYNTSSNTASTSGILTSEPLDDTMLRLSAMQITSDRRRQLAQHHSQHFIGQQREKEQYMLHQPQQYQYNQSGFIPSQYPVSTSSSPFSSPSATHEPLAHHHDIIRNSNNNINKNMNNSSHMSSIAAPLHNMNPSLLISNNDFNKSNNHQNQYHTSKRSILETHLLPNLPY